MREVQFYAILFGSRVPRQLRGIVDGPQLAIGLIESQTLVSEVGAVEDAQRRVSSACRSVENKKDAVRAPGMRSKRLWKVAS